MSKPSSIKEARKQKTLEQLATQFFDADGRYHEAMREREMLRDQILEIGSFETKNWDVSVDFSERERLAKLEDVCKHYRRDELEKLDLIRKSSVSHVKVRRKRGTQ